MRAHRPDRLLTHTFVVLALGVSSLALAAPPTARMSDKQYFSDAVQYPTSVKTTTKTRLLGILPVKLTARYGVHTHTLGNKSFVVENEVSVAGIKMKLDNVRPVDRQHYLVRTRATQVSDWMLKRVEAGKASTTVQVNDGVFDKLLPGARGEPRSIAVK